MAAYTFRCPLHGDFTVEQPMERTTKKSPCRYCGFRSPKVLSGHVTYRDGREKFHGG